MDQGAPKDAWGWCLDRANMLLKLARAMPDMEWIQDLDSKSREISILSVVKRKSRPRLEGSGSYETIWRWS
jgi:hypothetical protein